MRWLFLVACAPLEVPALSEAVDAPYSYCGLALPENAPAFARARDKRLHDELDEVADVLIVPGFSAGHEETEHVSPIAKERLLRAVLAFRRGVAPFILLTGSYNEATAMRRWLTDGGVPESAIFIEPCAKHSTTNLRNAGRLMLSAGLPRGLIVTSFDQAMYFGRPLLSTFYWRCLKHLGYMVGEVWHVDAQTVGFIPSLNVFQRGEDRADP